MEWNKPPKVVTARVFTTDKDDCKPCKQASIKLYIKRALSEDTLTLNNNITIQIN
jgi:hypothetical protein